MSGKKARQSFGVRQSSAAFESLRAFTHSVPRRLPPLSPAPRVNVMQALEDANPVVRFFLDWRSGKTVAEAMSRQFPRFAMMPGKAPDMAEHYAEVVSIPLFTHR